MSDKNKDKDLDKFLNEAVNLVRARENHDGKIPDKRLKYRWNLIDSERKHVKECGFCRDRMRALYVSVTPKEKREIMKRGLARGEDLTLKEILQMLNPVDGHLGIDDIKKYNLENGQRVIEMVCVEDCPCKDLAKLVNETFGMEVISLYKPTWRERLSRWWNENSPA